MRGPYPLMLIVIEALLLMLTCVVRAQPSRKPLSVDDIEYLLQQGVTVRQVASVVEEQGVKFEVTEAVRERLRKAGADSGVITAVEQASVAYARRDVADLVGVGL